MKRFMFALCACLAALAVIGMSGCNSCNTSGSAGGDTIAVDTDSVVVNNKWGHFRVVTVVPTGSNKMLRRLVNEWIAEQLGGSYDGSYDSIAPIMRLAIDSSLADVENTMADVIKYSKANGQAYTLAGSSSFDRSFAKRAEGADFATWCSFGYNYYEGSAHGTEPTSAQTFRKSDGRRIGWEVFKNTLSDGFQKLMHNGLKHYYNVKTDDELKATFLNEDDFYGTPLPQCPPIFTKEGVEFVYNQYEIAPYASGMPTFTVSYKDLRPYMTRTARDLIEKKN